MFKNVAGVRWTRGITALLLAGVMAILAACGQSGQDQAVADFGIAYTKRPVPTVVNDDTGEITLVDPDVRQAIEFNAGGDVYFRDRASPTAPERNLTFCITGGLGDVKDLESSYDGTKLIFSLRLEDTSNGQDVPKWNIYEYDTATGDCPRRIIQSDTFAQKGDDVAPYYLPDGHIVFSSSWQKTTGAVLLDEGKPQFPPVNEERSGRLREPTLVLHVMNADGSNVQQISFNQSHDLDASVLASGEIIFSRWDNMGRRNNIRLYKMRPDGTGLKPVYGVHDSNVGTNGGTVQFLSPRELEDGRLMVMLKPFNGSRGGGAAAIINIAEYADNTEPTWPNQGALTGLGQRPAVNLDMRTDGSISPAGRFRSVYPLWDGSNRALVSWSQCRLLKTEADNSVTLMPCPGTIPNSATEAFPLYGIYIYNLDEDTQLPVVVPQEGILIDEPVVLAPRPRPEVLYDRAPGFELNPDLFDETVGILHIRSVYDFDGQYSRLGGTNASLSAVAMATPDNRPARFLRIIKGASIPGRDVYRFNRGRAFGNSGQSMREIIGYALIEPDGSVMVKVPANVPLAISVVDVNGRRIGARHQNWIQVRPGEVVECNGCHVESAGRPHGYADQPPPVNTGAPTTGAPFPGTNPAITALIGETMAETRFRAQCGADFSGVNFSTAANLDVVTCPGLSPDVNVRFDDVWTDPAATPAPSFVRLYSDLTPNPDPLAPSTMPTTAACATQWDFRCRTIISYEQHIHPLWSVPRTDPSNLVDSMNTDWTCTNCHTDQVGGVGALTLVDAGQLDLSDGELNNRFESYEELFVQDVEEELSNGVFQDALTDNFVEKFDNEGNPVFQTDPITGELILDGNGTPIPVLVNEPITTLAPPPVMSTRGASNSVRFFNAMQNTRHAGMLSDAELRLISEWLDIGAQYYNNPFDAP
ncbi:MAG: hypothetical protein GXP17_11295 [Gammaproteobacteria bacterium]|nr:hypothetical protein [Gammaproteobacteria bacterium]